MLLVFIGWLRAEPDHRHMAAIPTLAEEDVEGAARAGTPHRHRRSPGKGLMRPARVTQTRS